MSVLIGHASGAESGNSVGGKAGDQNKKELHIREWYKRSWDVVLRPIDPIMAEKMAEACEAGCANDNIGYDQSQRNTLHLEALKVGYDLSKITTPCECDCSSFMCVCAIAGGAPINKLYIYNNMGTTRTLRNYFKSTGLFQILTNSKYLNSPDYLKRGDVVVNEGTHTFMVLTNGDKVDKDLNLDKQKDSIIGNAIAKTNLNIRLGPSTAYKAIGILKSGEKVEVLEITSQNWYRISWSGADSGYAYVSNSGNKYFEYTSLSNNSESTSTNNFKPYRVKVNTYTLRVRKGPGLKYGDAGYVRRNAILGVVEEVVDDRGKVWGLLDEFATTRDGWISLSYTEKI